MIPGATGIRLQQLLGAVTRAYLRSRSFERHFDRAKPLNRRLEQADRPPPSVIRIPTSDTGASAARSPGWRRCGGRHWCDAGRVCISSSPASRSALTRSATIEASSWM